MKNLFKILKKIFKKTRKMLFNLRNSALWIPFLRVSGEHVLSFFITAIITIFILNVTSYPSTSAEIWNDLKRQSLKEIKNYKEFECEKSNIKIDIFRSLDIDASPLRTILAIGHCAKKDDESVLRWIAIYESEKPTILDRFVERPAGYKISWFGVIQASVESLIATDIDTKDLDRDGVPEFNIRLKSQWGDAKSFGPLIFKKNEIEGGWHAFGLPNMTILLRSFIGGTNKTLPPLPNLSPITYFDVKNGKGSHPPTLDEESLKTYEDDWTLKSTFGDVQFSTLRNGGDYSIGMHPREDHLIIRTITFLDDERSVMDSHYAAIFFFKLDQGGLAVDDLWNWGYPMISMMPMRRSDIFIDDIEKAGIEAQSTDRMYFGRTNFERR